MYSPPKDFSRDAVNHRLLLDLSDLEGVSSVEVAFGPEGTNVVNGTLDDGAVVFPCPVGTTINDAVSLRLFGRAERQSWSGTISQLADATPVRLLVSRCEYDPWRGYLRLIGWAAGLPADCRLVLFQKGAYLTETSMTVRRPDVVANRPLLPEVCGFELRIDLAGGFGAEPLELRAVSQEKVPLASRVVPVPDNAGTEPPYQAFRARAEKLPQWRLEKLIASEPFRRRWTLKSKGGPSLAWLAREAVASVLAKRLRSGDEIAIRLADGDLVLANPVDDAVLARRYLLEAGDEAGFVDWLKRQAGPGDVAIDLGGAYGVMSRALARAGARVVTVEADAVAADRIERSGLEFGAGRIELVRAAVSNASGEVVFAGMGRSTVGSGKVLDDGSQRSIDNFLATISALNSVPLSMFKHDLKERRRFSAKDVSVVRVPAVTLDGLCEQFGLRDVAVVKLDIEGGELMALRGGLGLLDGAFGRPPIVAFEYSSLFPIRGGRREEILDIFLSRKWKLWCLEGGKNGGGKLIRIPDAASAPAHDNLIAVPPRRRPK